jgi:hypothetical protein
MFGINAVHAPSRQIFYNSLQQWAAANIELALDLSLGPDAYPPSWNRKIPREGNVTVFTSQTRPRLLCDPTRKRRLLCKGQTDRKSV